MKRVLNVLISHECSGQSRRAWRALGHSAWSCDLLPATDGETRFHIRGDGIEAMRRGRPTDGAPWDLVLTHHICRYLANSGALRLYKGGKKSNGRDEDRWQKMAAGAADFRQQFFVPEYRGLLCAENPIMHGHARRLVGMHAIPQQVVQPYNFGDNASKATVLWLRGLPPLRNTAYFPPRMVCRCGWTYAVQDKFCVNCGETIACAKPRWGNQTDSGQNKLPPSEGRAAARAVTYPGIAKAMAAQWSEYILNLRPSTP